MRQGEEKAALAAVVSSLPDAIVTADPQARILLVNAAAEALLGVRAAVEVRVTDNGLGLSDSDLDRVFGLFDRGRTGVPGTGMGLAVARQMLERLGGSILAHSEGLGCGSEFTLLLPVSGER